MALLMIPGHAAREVVPANGHAFTLDEMQAFVGGYIEILRLPDGRALVINEEGKLRGLPLNPEATVLAAPRIAPDFIVGPALVCTWNEAGGV
ncbi:MAG: DUF3846 domain-containing protein [Vicinamibacterales bacterium]